MSWKSFVEEHLYDVCFMKAMLLFLLPIIFLITKQIIRQQKYRLWIEVEAMLFLKSNRARQVGISISHMGKQN